MWDHRLAIWAIAPGLINLSVIGAVLEVELFSEWDTSFCDPARLLHFVQLELAVGDAGMIQLVPAT
jgi:hypothetical protein